MKRRGFRKTVNALALCIAMAMAFSPVLLMMWGAR